VLILKLCVCVGVFIIFVSALTSQALPFTLSTNRKSLGALPGEKHSGICTVHTHTLTNAGFMRTLRIDRSWQRSLSHMHTHTQPKNFCSKGLVKFNRDTECPSRALPSTVQTQTNQSSTLRQNTCPKCPFYKSACVWGKNEKYLWLLPNLCKKHFQIALKLHITAVVEIVQQDLIQNNVDQRS